MSGRELQEQEVQIVVLWIKRLQEPFYPHSLWLVDTMYSTLFPVAVVEVLIIFLSNSRLSLYHFSIPRFPPPPEKQNCNICVALILLWYSTGLPACVLD